jgi:hypothetical protein
MSNSNYGARHHDGLTNWSSVAKWLWLWPAVQSSEYRRVSWWPVRASWVCRRSWALKRLSRSCDSVVRVSCNCKRLGCKCVTDLWSNNSSCQSKPRVILVAVTYKHETIYMLVYVNYSTNETAVKCSCCSSSPVFVWACVYLYTYKRKFVCMSECMNVCLLLGSGGVFFGVSSFGSVTMAAAQQWGNAVFFSVRFQAAARK